ncbi:hypothetical protein [Actinobacillus pleuropneumoniae]|uniref:hypothetical protein n=1 Tax=Actinobacillus pleuropneumoniae TaxID=715 RepID=UPI003F7C20AB
MNYISIKIPGEFSDSFIYSGVLFLVDFDASLSIINWKNLINSRLERESEETQKVYKDIFFQPSKNIKFTEKRELEIDNFNDFLIHKMELSYWPTDINIFSNKLYFSSERGLRYIAFNGEKRFSSDAYIKKTENELFDDCKIFSFDIDNYRTVLCGGSEGGIYSFLSEKRLQILGDDKTNDWIDCNWHESAEFSILGLKSKSESRIQKFKNLEATKGRLNELSEKIKKNGNYTHVNRHLSKVQDLRKKVYDCARENLLEQYKEYSSKEEISYIKTRESSLGTFKEEENKLIIENNQGKISEILPDDEIVNWRIFPKAKTHLNQLHLIDNDHIKILGFEL